MRIIDRNRIYRPLSSRAIYEHDFVASILRAAATLFPSHVVAPYSPLIESEYGTCRPDLIMVDRRLIRWSIVEVELEHHSLSGHVEPQVRALVHGYYRDEHAIAAIRALPELDQWALRNLVLAQQPHVIVIAPESKERWRQALRSLGASLMVIQVFEDDNGNRLYRVNGDDPPADPADVLGYASRVAGLPTALEILGLPGLLEATEVGLMYEGELTRWRVVRPGGRLFLMPSGRCPLPQNSMERYQIMKTTDQVWRLQRNGN